MKIECPECFYQADCHAQVVMKPRRPGAPPAASPFITPKPGDATLCAHCGAILIYDEVGVSSATEDQAREILANPMIADFQRMLRQLRKTISQRH